MPQVEGALPATSAVLCVDSPSSDPEFSDGGGFSNSLSKGFTNALNSGSRSISGCQGFASGLGFDVMAYSMLRSTLLSRPATCVDKDYPPVLAHIANYLMRRQWRSRSRVLFVDA